MIIITNKKNKKKFVHFYKIQKIKVKKGIRKCCPYVTTKIYIRATFSNTF